MNRIKALFIADRIMTRIETDKAIHKDAIADEIQAGDVIDVISFDEAKGKWVFRDGTPIEPEAEKPTPVRPLHQPASADEIQRLREQYRQSLNAAFYYVNGIR